MKLKENSSKNSLIVLDMFQDSFRLICLPVEPKYANVKTVSVHLSQLETTM